LLQLVEALQELTIERGRLSSIEDCMHCHNIEQAQNHFKKGRREGKGKRDKHHPSARKHKRK
jgi:hypothetical protein